jgi:hypothetical protein
VSQLFLILHTQQDVRVIGSPGDRFVPWPGGEMQVGAGRRILSCGDRTNLTLIRIDGGDKALVTIVFKLSIRSFCCKFGIMRAL